MRHEGQRKAILTSMNDNSNLRPEVRVNKNGVPVVKHVRNDPAGNPANTKGFPPPQPKTASGPKLVTRQVMKDLESKGINLFDSSWGNKNIFHLAKNFPLLLEKVVERAVNSHGRERDIWTHLLRDTMQFNAGRSVLDMTPATYRKWMELLPLGVTLFRGESKPTNSLVYEINLLADSINKSMGIKPEYDGYRMVKSIMIAIRVDKAAGGTGRIVDKMGDIAFIDENLEAIEPLAETLMDRGTTDREILQQLIDSEAKSLSSGIL